MSLQLISTYVAAVEMGSTCTTFLGWTTAIMCCAIVQSSFRTCQFFETEINSNKVTPFPRYLDIYMFHVRAFFVTLKRCQIWFPFDLGFTVVCSRRENITVYRSETTSREWFLWEILLRLQGLQNLHTQAKLSWLYMREKKRQLQQWWCIYPLDWEAAEIIKVLFSATFEMQIMPTVWGGCVNSEDFWMYCQKRSSIANEKAFGSQKIFTIKATTIENVWCLVVAILSLLPLTQKLINLNMFCLPLPRNSHSKGLESRTTTATDSSFLRLNYLAKNLTTASISVYQIPILLQATN